MTRSTTLDGAVGLPTPDMAPSRLLVTVQDSATAAHEPVGLLTLLEDGVHFRYVPRVYALEGLRPLLGFPDLDAEYCSARMFPLFAQRLMRPSRPDFSRYRRSLHLEDSASRWEELARTQGQRHGDSIRVVAEPLVRPDGTSSATFFVNGLRHVLPAHPESHVVLSSLAVGDRLDVRAEPDNPADPRALVVTSDGAHLGYVPRVLLDHVDAVRAGGHALVVVGTNDASVAPAFRLLVRLDGRPGAAHEPFARWLAEPALVRPRPE